MIALLLAFDAGPPLFAGSLEDAQAVVRAANKAAAKARDEYVKTVENPGATKEELEEATKSFSNAIDNLKAAEAALDRAKMAGTTGKPGGDSGTGSGKPGGAPGPGSDKPGGAPGTGSGKPGGGSGSQLDSYPPVLEARFRGYTTRLNEVGPTDSNGNQVYVDSNGNRYTYNPHIDPNHAFGGDSIKDMVRLKEPLPQGSSSLRDVFGDPLSGDLVTRAEYWSKYSDRPVFSQRDITGLDKQLYTAGGFDKNGVYHVGGHPTDTARLLGYVGGVGALAGGASLYPTYVTPGPGIASYIVGPPPGVSKPGATKSPGRNIRITPVSSTQVVDLSPFRVNALGHAVPRSQRAADLFH